MLHVKTYEYNYFLQKTKTLGGTATFSEDHVHLSFGYPYSPLFPLEAIVEATQEEMARDAQALHYFGGDGTKRIREWIATRMQKYALETEAKQIVITAGAAQAIDILARILINVGDEVWVENPSFFGAIRSFKLAGATIQGFPLEADGVDVAAIEQELLLRVAQNKPLPKCLYIMPNFQNPTGITLSIEKRRQLAALATKYQFYILEDDAYAELNYKHQYLPAVASFNTEQVIYIGTFSKFIAPGVRLGWAVMPSHLLGYMQQFLYGSQTNPFMQQVIANIVQRTDFDAYIERLCVFYKQQRDVMVTAIQEQFNDEVDVTVPDGGFFISVYFKQEIAVEQLMEVAESLGVSIVEGSAFYVDGCGHQMIRLCFTYCSAQQIVLGIQRLKEAYTRLLVK